MGVACLSTTLLTLKIYTTFKDVQMMLKHFLISLLVSGIKKMEKSSPSIYRDVHGLCGCAADTQPKNSFDIMQQFSVFIDVQCTYTPLKYVWVGLFLARNPSNHKS